MPDDLSVPRVYATRSKDHELCHGTSRKRLLVSRGTATRQARASHILAGPFERRIDPQQEYAPSREVAPGSKRYGAGSAVVDSRTRHEMVTATVSAELYPVPTAFTAAMLNLYEAPVVRPVTVCELTRPVALNLMGACATPLRNGRIT